MTAHPGSRSFLLLLLLPLAAQTACSRSPADPPGPAGSSEPASASKASSTGPSARPSGAAAADAAGSLPAATHASVEKALVAYETIRARLAEDKTDGVGPAAAEIARAARSAPEGTPAPVRAHLETLASSAAALEKSAGGDLGKVREGFGDVSRALMGLLAAEPSFARGLYVFECPMTDTYKKWIQTHSEISNPYMGTRMLSCGTETTWQP